MKICYTSDLHGDQNAYRQLLDLVEKHQPTVLLLGGDLCPTVFEANAIDIQRRFLSTVFYRFVETIHSTSQVYWASGNHDLCGAFDVLNSFEKQGLMMRSDLRWLAIGESWQVLGFPFGPVSNWVYKDWERRDDDQSAKLPGPAVSYASYSGNITEVKTREFMNSYPSLFSELMALPEPVDASRAILLAHSPPYRSGLDKCAFGKHVGSRALCNYLLGSPCAVACHGHVHESPYMTGCWTSTVGGTLCVNPGQWGSTLHAITFDTMDVASTLTHTLFGRTGEKKIHHQSAFAIRRELERTRPRTSNSCPPAERQLIKRLLGLLTRRT
jgi:Icc-related predicted phosphoesterase